ncbi:MAG: Gfo/Idh/MocA family oxidoreductase [Sedimentisphaerales bacterium]|nr:Gfo/Idh/MocA family oxidoreductase [Sedimentisphaerales bacterium]
MNDKSEIKTGEVSRRDFIKTSVTAAAALAGGNVIFAASAKRKLKVALLGCGGRGKGALANCLEAARFVNGLELEVVGLADWFEDRIKEPAGQYNIPASRCFTGADAYRKLLETDVEVVLMATPPNFRPVHFEAAIKAGKHVFMEKPVAVDPPGGRKIIEAGETAQTKGLSVVAGTQRRHQRNYLRTAYAVEHGAIGKIRGGCIWWCGGALWYNTKNPNESDADYMIRNWVSFTEMSGDHIVEQHVHNIDIANWFIGHPPVRALGFGGRARRRTGNQFDFHSVQFDYDDDLHIHSMCRQINGCYNRVSEHFIGSEGATWGDGSNMDSSKSIEIPDFPSHKDPYVQEHIDLLRSIVDEKPINEARNVGESTLTAIMGRIATYTGQIVRWSDLTKEGGQWYDLILRPSAADFEEGNVTAPPDDVAPIPGRDA